MTSTFIPPIHPPTVILHQILPLPLQTTLFLIHSDKGSKEEFGEIALHVLANHVVNHLDYVREQLEKDYEPSSAFSGSG